MIQHVPAPMEDYGFFGPDSMAWKVHGYPTGFTIAFQRTVFTEVLEPSVLTSVAATGSVLGRPEVRYQRTLEYMATLTFGDSRSVTKASDILMKIHSRIVGIEPVSGQPYDANSPEGQLWIHLTAWHSLLYTYEMFGPGKLSEAEELQYWAECRRAAEFQNINLDEVPRNRDEMRAYYERMNPRLATTVQSREILDMIINGGSHILPSSWPRPVKTLNRIVFRRALIASLPHWLRNLVGVRQSRWVDAAVIALLRPIFAWIDRRPRLKSGLVSSMAPRVARVYAPATLGLAPTDPRVFTPAEARARYDVRDPRDHYQDILAKREAKALATSPAPDGTSPLLAFS